MDVTSYDGTEISYVVLVPSFDYINPLNAELNPICHLLALLGAHHILHFLKSALLSYKYVKEAFPIINIEIRIFFLMKSSVLLRGHRKQHFTSISGYMN